MKRIAAWLVLGSLSAGAVAVESAAAPEQPTAAEIVAKNVAARGGLEAWRKIQSMAWVGHIDSENAPEPSMPFVLEMKRPNKTRFALKAHYQPALRIYDGSQGWKMLASRGGKPELQPYNAAELSFAHDGPGLDGPLMDYAAKGIAVALDGSEELAGRKTYRLRVTMPSGVSHHVWIDAQTFLDVKYDRQARNSAGMTGTVSVAYRDYRTIEGLQIPMTIESGGDTGKKPDKMVIEKIALNPPLDDRQFAKPNVPGQRNVVVIDPPAPRPMARQMPSWMPTLSRPDSPKAQP